MCCVLFAGLILSGAPSRLCMALMKPLNLPMYSLAAHCGVRCDLLGHDTACTKLIVTAAGMLGMRIA